MPHGLARLRPALLGICLALLGVAAPARAGEALEPSGPARHAIAMHGEPALGPGFAHYPYANPDAPRSGRLTLGLQGTFDSLNPFVVKGVAPDAVPKYVLQSLMTRSLDEPFTVYGLVARAVDLPPDRQSVTFHLDPRARFSDGQPLTADDVRFSFELLKTHGKPFHRSTFSLVRAVEVPDPHTIRFDLAGVQDRELPLVIAMMPIFPAHATDPERFPDTTLQPIIGSGPYRISEVLPGERVVLTRRKDFWGEDLPVVRGLFNFDEIRYDFYRDGNTLFEAFKVGLYDVRVENDPARWALGYDFPALREGRVVRREVSLETPKGMNGFVLNTRRPLLADARVREALGLAFDFDWVNRNLYFGVLRRATSYFGASELSAYGVPAGSRERALLAPFPEVRPDILEGDWTVPTLDGSGRDRESARRALALLEEAGWTLDGGVLRHRETGAPFAFEITAISRQQERLALVYAKALSRLGIRARVRLVDDVQFWRRLAAFDFDVVQWTWPVSPSPGAEQRNRWSAAAAERSGSLNLAGARSPAVDAMIGAMLRAVTREDFVAAVRALDRVLLSGFYVVPLFHLPDLWIAHDATLKQPARPPLLGAPVELWWREPRLAGTGRT